MGLMEGAPFRSGTDYGTAEVVCAPKDLNDANDVNDSKKSKSGKALAVSVVNDKYV